MSKLNISKEAFADNAKASLSQYVNHVNDSDPLTQQIYDEILKVEERYKESSVVDQGGMKKIFKTTDTLTNRPVAKATLIDCQDSEKVENFLREARLTAALEHPNIIPVYDIGVDDLDGPFFTMKLVGGNNLATILKKLSSGKNEIKYSLQDLMEIFLKVCDAVGYAHSRGIIHLDLKPENIQVGDYGEVLVCDWGLAKVLEDPDAIIDFDTDLDPLLYNGLTLDGFIKGTPGYMAPEQIDTSLGPKDQKTDIYALGGILYSLLCFKAPFDSDTLDGVLGETLKGDLRLPSERAGHDMPIPPGLEAVAVKALECDPELRYATVTELRQEISQWLGGFATQAEDASFLKSFLLLMNRNKAVTSLLLILFISAVFGVYKIKQNENIAIANEQEAVENAKIAKANELKAIENEQKAKDALDLYKKEKEAKGKVNKYSLEQLRSINKMSLSNFNFDKALEDINASLRFQPDNTTLNAMKGEVHFYRQEFDEAKAALEKAAELKDKYPLDLMLKLCPKYIKITKDREYIPAANLVSLLEEFSEKYSQRLFAYEAQKFRLKDDQPFEDLLGNLPQLKNHIHFCYLMMEKEMSEERRKGFNFQYTLDKDGINLDLSDNIGYDPRPRYLNHLPLKTLDVSNSDCWRVWIFLHYSLKSVDIRNSAIKKIEKNILRLSKIKKIILTKEQYAQLKLHKSASEKIDFIIK